MEFITARVVGYGLFFLLLVIFCSSLWLGFSYFGLDAFIFVLAITGYRLYTRFWKQ